jgi:putative transposase
MTRNNGLAAPKISYVDIYGKALTDAFPTKFLDDTAHKVGLVKRERKIKPVVLFWAFVFTVGVHIERSLSMLKRNYLRMHKTKLSDSSWYERFSPELAEYFHQCAIHGIEHLAETAHRAVSERLKTFLDVIIADSTVIRLNEKLAKYWPTTRTRKAAAGVKVSVIVSAFANSLKSVSIFGERTNELKTLRIGPWIKGRILLFDLGYYAHQLFARIKDNDGYFVSRVKEIADPLIISSLRSCRGNSIDLAGKHIRDVLPRLRREVLDLIVEIELKRRAYNGKRKGDTERFRLVAIYNKDERRYHLYITNICAAVLSAEEIAKLYSARWEIELVFKELKSKYAFDVIKTTKKFIVEALIWSTIVVLLVSRIIYLEVRRMGEEQGKSAVRFTQMRWSSLFARGTELYLTTVMMYLGIDYTLDDYHQVQMSEALDPHVNRKRFRDGLWA